MRLLLHFHAIACQVAVSHLQISSRSYRYKQLCIQNINVTDASCPVHWSSILILWTRVLMYFINTQKHLVKHTPPILSPLPESVVRCCDGQESRFLQPGSPTEQRELQCDAAGGLGARAPQHFLAKLRQTRARAARAGKKLLAHLEWHSSTSLLLDTDINTVLWSETKWKLFWGRDQAHSQSPVAEGN